METTTKEQCIVCGGTEWDLFPISALNRSIRSDGMLLERPISKAQCTTCAIVRAQVIPEHDSLADLYTNEYDIYNNRPNSETFVTGRYKALARAIISATQLEDEPNTVLEVGCGNGAALQAVSKLWANADCVGLEPVTTAVQVAQANNINVHQGMIGGHLPEAVSGKKFDIVYSIHVIEHTENPIDFLIGLKDMLAEDGYLIITCPNARQANLEIMRPDHHFSMLPNHLNELALKAGLLPLRNTLCPGGGENLDYEHNQLLVCSRPSSSGELTSYMQSTKNLDATNQAALYDERKKYIEAFDTLDEMLLKRIQNAEKIYCFGTGGWTCMLAGYAPKLWSRIDSCVIDGASTELFYRKKIISYDALLAEKPDLVIIGTNPSTQPLISHRLENDGVAHIMWHDIIPV